MQPQAIALKSSIHRGEEETPGSEHELESYFSSHFTRNPDVFKDFSKLTGPEFTTGKLCEFMTKQVKDLFEGTKLK